MGNFLIFKLGKMSKLPYKSIEILLLQAPCF